MGAVVIQNRMMKKGSLPWCWYLLLLVFLIVALKGTICSILIISNVLTIEQSTQGHVYNVFQ